VIRITGLHKRFGRLEVLRGLDLHVSTGRITAIVGPNGSGKSTLIRIILGLVRADAGTIRLGDVVLNGDPGYRRHIGYMPQLPRFPDNLTAAEVFSMLVELRGSRGAGGVMNGARTAVSARDGDANGSDGLRDDSLITSLGLRTELDKRLGTLSAGTRQKVNAVIAFLFRPQLLILDEPTAGLDPVASAILKDRIRAERDAGRTVVLTTHVMSEVEELADEVAFLLDGSLQFVRSPATIREQTGEATLERGIARLMREGRTP
jgi:Cu-processing system ATP-binding protein